MFTFKNQALLSNVIELVILLAKSTKSKVFEEMFNFSSMHLQ
jgi:hypothetical protein